MINLNTDRPWMFSGMRVPPGEYVVEHVTAAQCMAVNPRAEVSSMEIPQFDYGKIDAGDSIIVCRVGAFGDLLCCVPTIDAIRDTVPHSKIAVACHPRYAPILDGLVDTIPSPITTDQFHKNHILWLESTIEHPDKNSKGLRYANRVAKRAGISIKGYGLRYHIKLTEIVWANATFPRERDIRIGVQCRASNLNRTYSEKRLIRVIQFLIHMGADIMLLGAPGQVEIPVQIDNVTNTMDMNLKVRESIAAASTCDALLVPDSMFLHIGTALKIPTLALFGPTDPAIVVQGLRGPVDSMIGIGACARCGIQPAHDGDWPAGKPCADEKRCVVIDSLDPEVVAHRVWKLATKNLQEDLPDNLGIRHSKENAQEHSTTERK